MTSFNLADLFEMVADHVPDRTAIVAPDRRLTYAGLDERANRLANHLADRGVGAGDFVGLQMLNGTPYIEGMLACFKLRAVPANVNHRYVEEELRYLFDDAGLVMLIVDPAFEAAAHAAAPSLATLVTGERYEAALAASSPGRPSVPRSGDDLYVAYTGGTTGMPKGVLWRHEDIFFAGIGGGDPLRIGNVVGEPKELLDRVYEPGLCVVPTPPFMHVSAHWVVLQMLFAGGKIVIPPPERFDPGAVWRLVGAEGAHIVVIVGDAMGRPLADALERGGYDTSTVMVIGSGGALLSPATKERLSKLLPNAFIVDGFGSSETGTMGTQRTGQGSGPARLTFAPDENTAVFADDGRRVRPGETGRLARSGHIPLGYHNDPAKTAESFAVCEGRRWVLPGDMATVEDDGTIVVLGRGSVSINTGGEKVFPEEVEGVLRDHPGVADCVVVGVPDERWGERVVAVVQPARTPPSVEDLRAHAKGRLAGYKMPRELVLVDRLERQPSGKPDYRWARERAAAPHAPAPTPAPKQKRTRASTRDPLRVPGHPGAKRDPATIERWRPVLDLYVKWWRPDVRGFGNLPERGPFLLVGNHSGGATPPDMPILMTAWWRERGTEEPVYGLFHSAFLNLPGARAPIERFGAIEAGWDEAERILRDGGSVLVYPGGDHEAFRPWRERNRIDFAGRTGWVKLAQRTGVPVVPVVTHGVQDGVFVLTRGEKLLPFMPHLRLMRLKVAPVMLGLPTGISLGWPTLPLPTKATVQVCEPVRVGPDDDPAEVYARVTGAMQSVLDELRGSG